jgi:hypothetical protein
MNADAPIFEPMKMNADAPIFEPMKIVETVKAHASAGKVAMEKENSQLAMSIKLFEQENAILRMKVKGLATGGPRSGVSGAAGFPLMPPGATWWPGMSPWAVPPGDHSLSTDISDSESTMDPTDSCRSLSCDSDDLESIAPPPGLECIAPPPGLGPPGQHTQHKATIMMRNIPVDYTRSMLLTLLDEQGFSKYCYDMVYLPTDFGTGKSFGYAFIHFVSTAEAERFTEHFRAFNDWAIPSEQDCEVDWSNTHQDLSEHIARYQNSPVMHESVPDEHKPILFDNGERVQFPAPTKKLRAPRGRTRP